MKTIKGLVLFIILASITECLKDVSSLLWFVMGIVIVVVMLGYIATSVEPKE
jgi:hypothetical protein